MKDSEKGNADYRPFNWPKAAVILSLLAVPVSYAVYANMSGENHFGQGLERSIYRPAFWAVQALAFLGVIVFPCFRGQSERQKDLLKVVGTLGFLIIEALSFALIAFNGFPD